MCASKVEMRVPLLLNTMHCGRKCYGKSSVPVQNRLHPGVARSLLKIGDLRPGRSFAKEVQIKLEPGADTCETHRVHPGAWSR